jgi:N-acetyl-anhydromuramyl-L-alanine amidase AmpD
MLFISKHGHIDAERVKVKIFTAIERGSLDRVNGIVVHQTDGSTANSTFSSYQKIDANGAHLLIDKDGTIYQTASLHKITNHVGKLRSRCLKKKTCPPVEIAKMSRMNVTALSRHEIKKSWPDRYPSNTDSIGIEIVGASANKIYEAVNAQQNDSLKWLVTELAETFRVSLSEVYRHPEVSYKLESEASTAQW